MARQPHIVRCRKECCYELRRTITIQGRQISLPEIGRHLGGLDHATVLYSIRKHAELLAKGEEPTVNKIPVLETVEGEARENPQRAHGGTI
jgi:chromosomal replication initiation ATPase DnaA